MKFTYVSYINTLTLNFEKHKTCFVIFEKFWFS